MVKASHLLRYSSLRQLETETGAEFVGREQKEFIALREVGINVDDSLRLTKFIQQHTTNSKHKSLTQTIFFNSKHDIFTYYFFFETYHPGEQTPVESSAPSVNAIFCNYCQKKRSQGEGLQEENFSDEKNKKRKTSNDLSENSSQVFSGKRERFPCCICKAKEHRTHECPRLPEVHKCLADSEGANRKTPAWGRDENDDDEDA
jgi:hypothetical protein